MCVRKEAYTYLTFSLLKNGSRLHLYRINVRVPLPSVGPILRGGSSTTLIPMSHSLVPRLLRLLFMWVLFVTHLTPKCTPIPCI